jgi:hypothetical protein
MSGDRMKLGENLEMAGARIVFIVSRTEPYLYGYVRSAFAEVQAVDVILDRRQGERRHGDAPPRVNRRRSERRTQDVSTALQRLGWAVIVRR